MKRILYVDACVNRETSRTEQLAQALLARLHTDDTEVETLVLENATNLMPLTGEAVLERGTDSKAGDFSSPLFDYAKQFAQADEVVFAAPYWDFSFPSQLKIYLELLCAQGVTFHYSEDGIPTGLCKATRAFFVTTAGGYIGQWDYGYAQIEALCTLYFGIGEIQAVRAEGLDIVTNDSAAIMKEALQRVCEMAL